MREIKVYLLFSAFINNKMVDLLIRNGKVVLPDTTLDATLAVDNGKIVAIGSSESMVKGENTLEAGTPASFDVLTNEVRGLGLNMQLEKGRA